MHMRVFFAGDTEINEEYNSLIKIACRRAPNIALPLVSARCNLKKAMNVGSSKSLSRWQLVRPSAARVLQEALDGQQYASAVTDDAQRWQPASRATVPPSSDLDASEFVLNPALRPDHAWKWAAAQNTAYFNRVCFDIDISCGFTFAPTGCGDLIEGEACSSKHVCEAHPPIFAPRHAERCAHRSIRVCRCRSLHIRMLVIVSDVACASHACL
jgi:hypothetical protein